MNRHLQEYARGLAYDSILTLPNLSQIHRLPLNKHHIARQKPPRFLRKKSGVPVWVGILLILLTTGLLVFSVFFMK